MDKVFNFKTDECRRCVCHACKDKGSRFCQRHCDSCVNRSGELRRRRCIYVPGE